MRANCGWPRSRAQRPLFRSIRWVCRNRWSGRSPADSVWPFLRKHEDFVGSALLRVDQYRVGSSRTVRFRALQGLGHSKARYQRLDASDDDKLPTCNHISARRVFFRRTPGYRPTAAALLRTNSLWGKPCPRYNAGNAALLQLVHESPKVVEIPIAGIAVQQDGNAGGIGHQLHVIEYLRP